MDVILKDITVKYKQNSPLEGLSLKIPEGRILSVLGTSGIGKTTLLKVISGLIVPHSGRVFFGNKDVTPLPAEKRNIGFVFQDPLLFPHMSVFENIRFGLEIKKLSEKEIRERVDKLMDRLQILELKERMPSMISGGQQQRVALARALAVDPPVLLMDEPFSNLDHRLRQEMGAIIKSIQKEMGVTVVFVTHDRNESQELSDEIAILSGGKIVQAAEPKELFYKPVNREVALYMGEANFINGIVRANRFICALGMFEVQDYEDGDYEWLIRPHQILISKKTEGNGYTITDLKVSGKEIKYEISNGKLVLKAETIHDQSLEIGDQISITTERIKMHLIRSKAAM